MDLNSSIKTYPDIAEHAFGYKGRMAVSILLHLELYLVATGFLISEGDNLHNLLPDMVVLEVAGLKIGGSKQSFVVIIALIILPSVWLDDLSIVSYISVSGVLASFIVIGSTAWAGAVDGVGFHRRGVLVSLAGLPTTVSLYTFCYCAHPVFPTLYTSMKHKHQFSQVLLLCFVISTIGYASMAVMGYLMFGSSVKSQVTLNLPIEKLSSRIAICTTLINPITKYALMITPIRAAFENGLPRRYNKGPIRLLIRTTLLISTVIVALVFPFFGYLMALVGAFLSAIASMLLPCICYLKIFGNNQGLGYEPVIIMGILLFGISVVVVGTYTSLAQIIQRL
ncbi:PREDICTED: vacuolar amino acid transporter 1-like [Nelumbo nucifera]|nr:PREDICTED: vacuolar amino acid transporter 1-like [Nelumbo nucifera]